MSILKNISSFTLSILLLSFFILEVQAQNINHEHPTDSLCLVQNIIYPSEDLDIKPTPPGGFMSFRENLRDAIIFPQSALENGIAGRVSLSFVICPDGEIHQVKVVAGKSQDCDREAIRVLRSMGKWQAGEKDGELVYSKVRFSVNFRKPED